MSLKERVYSVLVVSADKAFNSALTALLRELAQDSIHTVSNVSTAKRVIAERGFDFVIVNAAATDDQAVSFSIDAARHAVVLLLVRREFYPATDEKASAHGVFTLAKPTTKDMLITALHWMSSARELLRRSEKKTLSVEEKMEEIRLVNRAKWLLISELKMTEPYAHRYIEKQAMDRCVSKREIAEQIIRQYSR